MFHDVSVSLRVNVSVSRRLDSLLFNRQGRIGANGHTRPLAKLRLVSCEHSRNYFESEYAVIQPN